MNDDIRTMISGDHISLDFFNTPGRENLAVYTVKVHEH